MHRVRWLICAIVLANPQPLPAQDGAATLTKMRDPVAQVEEALAKLQLAIAHGDLRSLADLISDCLVYIDNSGNRIGKTILLKRRDADGRRTTSEKITEREIIGLAPDVVLARWRADTVATYFGGLPRPGWGRDSWLWQREADGRWRVVHAQTTNGVLREYPSKQRVQLRHGQVAALAGEYRLNNGARQLVRVQAAGDELRLTIDGQINRMPFLPDGPRSFFSTDRPWELRFSNDNASLVLVTWGAETSGARDPTVPK